MLWRNTVSQYGFIHKAFHWVIAALIIGNLALGLVAANAGMSPAKFSMFFWHKSIGITVLALVTLRLVWKLLNPAPASMPDHAMWERALAKLVHWLLYFAAVTMPLSGWLGSAAGGFAVSFFGWFTLPNLVPSDKKLSHLLFNYHSLTGYALIGLIGLHVLGALKHHVIDRDDTLRRMLPFGRVRDTAVLLVLLTLAHPAHATPPAWTIDHEKSKLTFTATQNQAPFTGTFGEFTGTISFDQQDLPNSRATINIPIASLSTGSAERDPYLGQDAWFDSAKFPAATYSVTSFSLEAGGGRYIAHGQLTLHGITKPVDLPFTFIYAPDRKSATAHGTVTLHRLDFAIGTGEWADPKAIGTDVKVDVLVVAHTP